MFEDLIVMLLEKKAQVNATLDKIDKLLAECGYVEPKVETVEVENQETVLEETLEQPTELTETYQGDL